MRKIISLFLCCILLAGCSTVPMSMESVTPPADKTTTKVEPFNTFVVSTITEPAEKESVTADRTDLKDTTTETDPVMEVTITSPTETEPSATTKPTVSSAKEVIEPEAVVTEPVVEESALPPEVNPAEIEQLVVEYINQYREEQGDTTATVLPRLIEVARYRAEQLITNFSHNSIPDACDVLQYGEFIDMTLYGAEESGIYYRGYSREAIGKGDWFGTADQMAERMASVFRNSAGHWSYIGSSEYLYIAVGIIHAENKWYVCICMSEKNYGG